ncbi:serine protease [Nostoc sp. FACHB-110]|uniref:trypsin-like serine peptidase n=1 Tax=Nostoc sp. FACHB-110 TaxID=2692834 RepID=UPI0016842340|nr:trypsin-like serine protease [Nostoc sp. FACHB-110]MBD2435805.1 trypsin-like serine protease [Nostoc sp. FACHB-110]
MHKFYVLALNIPVLAASLAVLPLPVFAQNRDVVIVNKSQARLSDEQIKNSRAFKNPLPSLFLPNLAPETGAARSSLVPGAGTKGAIPDNPEDDTVSNDPIANFSVPRAFGSFGVPYTSKRVSHLPTSAVSSSSNAYLSATYPYSTMGRLSFNAGHCSATLIRRSVIVTAAHCVQDFGSGSNLYTNFTFTPAYYYGSAPYGSWSWRILVRPSSWANGTDTGSGAARNNDLAVILLNKNSQGQFIGDITGYLAYGWNNYSFVSSSRTGNLSVAALTTTGYPGLLDSGSILQRTDGPSYLTTVSGAKQIYQGSNLTGGASGGAWIANFGYQNPVFSGGANAGNSSLSNVVVGVTSWGTADPNNPKDNYSSQFAQNTQYPNSSYGTYGAGNIGSLLNTLCSSKPSGSSQTYQQLGYCN